MGKNSADPDEMQRYAAFHLGRHCLPNTRLGVSSIQRGNENPGGTECNQNGKLN